MSDRTRIRRGERQVAVLLASSIVGAIGLAVVYWNGGNTQWEGVFVALAFGGIGGALVVWAHRLLPADEAAQRWDLGVDPEDRAAALRELDRDEVLERRPLLRWMFAGAIGALGIAALFPIRSLGPDPGNSLRATSWRRGLRLITEDGRPVTADGVPLGSMVTVFPDGHAGEADAVAVLVRTRPGSIEPAEGRENWSPEGLIAYSKVCTHAGCPVGVYLDDTQTLLCPCHQSEFDVAHHAEPLSGPAARPLPQLPLEIDADGVVVAGGDFSEPAGPAWWSR